MANVTYTVVKGDYLNAIAKKFNTTASKIAQLNNIPNPDKIYVGQVLIIEGTAQTTQNKSNVPIIEHFGVQSNTDRTVFATWIWDKGHVKHYEVRWDYNTGDGVWFAGSEETVTTKISIYNAPSNAVKVRFKVRPISSTYTVKPKQEIKEDDKPLEKLDKAIGNATAKSQTYKYWTADWSTESIYYFKDNPPSKPSAPKVEIKDFTLTAELDNLDVNAEFIQFQVVKNDSDVFKTGKFAIKTNHASYSCTVEAGARYKVRCRAGRGEEYSEWSEYSSNVGTKPSVPGAITTCKAKSETSVYLEWKPVENAETYEVEYTTEKHYFDNSDQTTIKSDIKFPNYIVAGLEQGDEYFFRVRAVNEDGESGWSGIKSVAIGTEPIPPTTWSSTTKVMIGEPLNLYWVHNSADGSNEVSAKLELTVNGNTEVLEIANPKAEEDEVETRVYPIDTNSYAEGASIQWRVRTCGITGVYGEWSILRTVDVYAPPTLQLNLTDHQGDNLEILSTFPFYVTASAGPDTQTPIGYHLTVISNETYDTEDDIGNFKMVKENEQVYSGYFDIVSDLSVQMSAANLNIANNISYTVTCVVTMNSGLTATASEEFKVSWTDIEFQPNAEIAYDAATASVSIRPYCEDYNGVPIENVTLAVYRREFDGSFTEIASGIVNSRDTFVIDPHPALDRARYRIVATSDITGSVSYYDMPGYPIGESSIIIQWDESWSNFEVLDNSPPAEHVWSGSLLRLPYNIDVSDTSNPEVTFVEYVGRKHPVSYYGTHLGVSSSWRTVIPADDLETLYALRRLSVWMGNVYVREPSGTGYWAQVTVGLSQKHLDLTIPVTLEVRRVEGGI